MDTKIVQLKPTVFENFYDFFSESLRKQFPHFSKNTLDYYLEVEYPKQWLKERVKRKDRILFLAKTGDKIAGFIMANKPYGGLSFAMWIAVDPKFQNQGIATKLLKAWEKKAKSLGAHKLHLETTKNNLDFYKKRGFTFHGEFPDAWFGIDYYAFYKTVRKSDEKNYLRNYLKSKT